MKIKEIMESIDIENFGQANYEEIKKSKLALSNAEKRTLTKILVSAKKETKEKVLLAIICYAIWYPDEAIELARRKGVFRYKIFGMKGKNQAKFYLSFLLKHAEVFRFTASVVAYLEQKNNCNWLEEFYTQKEEKINKIMKSHHEKRIRKRVNNVNLESALFKELLAYIDMLFFKEYKAYDEKDFNELSSFSREEIAEGASYLLYKYIEQYGISKEKNYFVDVNFICSSEMNELLLNACQINYMLEIELLVDFYDYDVFSEGNNIIIKSREASLEKSIRYAYIKNEMQGKIFYSRLHNEIVDTVQLNEISAMVINELGDRVVTKVQNGILSRYVFGIPTDMVIKIAEQKYEGKVALFEEEALELAYFAKEMCMTPNELYEKKITEHCNIYDILLCQRFFRFVYYMQKEVFDKEKNLKTVLQSLIPSTSRRDLIGYLTLFLKDSKKAEEAYALLEYDENFKFDIQYTPFLGMGERVIYPISILAHSNLIRNTIAYSYLSKNEIVNNDGGLEPLVTLCANSFRTCNYDYKVYTNLNFNYKGKAGEIDVLVVSDNEVIIIECKAPLMPTSNFEMRATFEHIEKASTQLDLSKTAFEDEGFRRKFFKDCIKLDGKYRKVRTCIVMGNRMFSIWSGFKHPIRYIYELDMILNDGEIRSPFSKWNMWKNENYSHEDLVDFLDQKGTFIKIMQNSMDKYCNKVSFAGKDILYESYLLNMEKLFLNCDKELCLIEKNEEEWNKFIEICKLGKRMLVEEKEQDNSI